MAFYFGAFLIFPQISLHLVFCLIAGVLGLHLTFIFLGREAKSREIYKVKCQSQFKGARKFSSNECIRSTPSFLLRSLAPCAIPSNNLNPCKFYTHVRCIHEMQRNKYVVASSYKLCSISNQDPLKSVPSRAF